MHRAKRERESAATGHAARNIAFAVASVKRSTICDQYNVTIEEADMFRWRVDFPKETFVPEYPELYHDLEEWSESTGNASAVALDIAFPPQYPATPPFVRVVQPRFKFHTGHVTVGGSICTPLLTGSAWRSDISAEALLLTLHATLIDGKARVDMRRRDEYCESEAREAFDRVARDHGWVVP